MPRIGCSDWDLIRSQRVRLHTLPPRRGGDAAHRKRKPLLRITNRHECRQRKPAVDLYTFADLVACARALAFVVCRMVAIAIDTGFTTSLFITAASRRHYRYRLFRGQPLTLSPPRFRRFESPGYAFPVLALSLFEVGIGSRLRIIRHDPNLHVIGGPWFHLH